MRICASAWTKQNVLEGDGQSPKFEKGDWFKVTFSGEDASGKKVGEVELYLADYRSEDEKDHYILDTWQWIDLLPILHAEKVTLTADGSKKNEWGLTTASYVAIDNYGEYVVPVSKGEISLVEGAGTAVSPMFTFDPGKGAVTVSAVSLPDGVVLEDGVLSVESGAGDVAGECVLHGMQKGHHEYVSVSVKGGAGVGVITESPVWSVAGGVLRVSLPEGGQASLWSVDGRMVAGAASAGGAAEISLEGVARGVYVLKAGNARGVRIVVNH